MNRKPYGNVLSAQKAICHGLANILTEERGLSAIGTYSNATIAAC